MNKGPSEKKDGTSQMRESTSLRWVGINCNIFY